MTGLILNATIPIPPGLAEADLLRILLFQAGYNTTVVTVSTVLLGIGGGVIGSLALLRGRAMMSDALAHCTLPGLALAFLVFERFAGAGRTLAVLLAGASLTALVGGLAVAAILRHGRLRDDTALAVVLAVFFGVGIVLLSYVQKIPGGHQGGLGRFIYGQAAALQVHDAVLLGLVAVLATAVVAVLFKELRLLCFDPEYGATLGVPVQALDLLLMFLVLLIVVVGLQAVGLVLAVAVLIIPPAGARLWTERLGVMVVVAAGLGALSGYAGAVVSASVPHAPTGAVIVLCAGALFGISLLIAPARGVLAAVLRLARLRWRVGREHVLRALYELLEADRRVPQAGVVVPLARLRRRRNWRRGTLVLLLAGLWASGAVRLCRVRGGPVVPTFLGDSTRNGEARGSRSESGLGVQLTERGASQAARVVRNHRLWETFLVTHAHMAPSRVDRTADLIEHALGEERVRELEALLQAEGRLPHPGATLPSPHPLLSEPGP